MIPALLASLWTKFAGYITAAGAILAVLFVAYTRGKSAATAAQTEQRIKSMTKARKIDDEIDRLGDDAVGDRLNEWLRDK